MVTGVEGVGKVSMKLSLFYHEWHISRAFMTRRNPIRWSSMTAEGTTTRSVTASLVRSDQIRAGRQAGKEAGNKHGKADKAGW